MFDEAIVPTDVPEGGYPSALTVPASAVAAEIRRRLPGIGTKKLHKLLYYCQGHHLVAFEQPIFTESVSAWDMGPVVGRLWWAEKSAAGRLPDSAEVDGPVLDEAVLNTVGYVLSRYGRLSGRDLENMTHAEDPWRRADRQREPRGSETIRNEWILEYFRTDSDDEDSLWFDREVRTSFLAGAMQRRGDPASVDSVDGIRSRAS